MLLRYTAFWCVLMIIAIGNGMAREFIYGKHVTELLAHQLSTFSAMLLTGLAVWLISRTWPIVSGRQAWMIGLLWLLMTLSFEFVFGHYVAGHSWDRLLQDYHLLAGRIWPVFLLWILCLPYVVNYRSHRNNST